MTEGHRSPLVVHNLQQDLAALAPLLEQQVQRGSRLDSYLLAAAMSQIVDDYLQPEIYPLDQAVEYLDGPAPSLSWLAGRASAGAARGARALADLRPSTRPVVRWQGALAQLVDALAGLVVAPEDHTAESPRLRERCDAVVRAVDELPLRLQRGVMRVPACFRSFDQQPADLARLIRDFGARWPSRRRPLLVVGVRTSGSYLAPLCAALLRADGWEEVGLFTVRPGSRLHKRERALVRAAASRGGLALITDDPPGTGASIARSARQLVLAGLDPGSIVLLLQLFGHRRPSMLDRYPAMILPGDEWAIRARLDPAAVQRELSALLPPPASVVAVTPMQLTPPQNGRGHCRACFRVRLRDEPTDQPRDAHVLVEGVGLGYLGAQVLAGARAAPGFSPQVFGLSEGLLYREWLPDERRVDPLDAGAAGSLASAIAAYVSARRRALPVSEDVSLRVAGQQPTWEVASTILSRTFGRAWPVARIVLVDRTVKRLLHVEQPSVVDGGTDLGHWFSPDRSGQSVVKVQPPDASFSSVGLSCFDAAFDLAGATARAQEGPLPRMVREAYAELGNPPVDQERWLLYELAHIWGRQRRHPEEEVELRRARSRALQRYFADIYLRDVSTNSSGPLCALDVDGVLETEHLGFPAITPAGASSLRALMLHGYRPLLVTGRSLGEVAERCRAYRLAGGVAEYGAVSYLAEGGRVRKLLPDGAAPALGRLRRALREIEGLHLDEDYRFAVRAYTVDRNGSRRGLGSKTTVACLGRAGVDRIHPIPGEGQTDFVFDGVDKATGLRALAADLGTTDGGGRPFALVVGDTMSDVPCAAVSERAYAPGHAPAAMREGGFDKMTLPYQAGLAQATGTLLGHPPGACRVCRAPSLTRESRRLLALLAAQERGRRSMVAQAAKLALMRR
jgi:hypothetical protein